MTRPGLQLELFSAPPADPGGGQGEAAGKPAERRVQALRERLARRLGESVRLEVHDNRSTMVSYRRERGTLALRVHHMFLSADDETTAALADFASARRRRRHAGRLLDAFIRRHQGFIRPARPTLPLDPRGRVHDLSQIFRLLNERYFAGAIEATIGWSRAPLARRRRTIKMGVYYHESRTIRVHPALDHPSVPGYVVEFIVYHEMLHQACPTEVGPRGQKLVHTRAFRARERAHPDHARALAWEKAHLEQLLARRKV
ncbi:MAG: hypothetical protein ACYDCL_03100 [Myxococcales bacterium]